LLVVLGALWFAVGAVLVVLAWIYGRGTGAIPDSLDFDPALVTAAPRSVALGLVGVAAGVGQAGAGWLAARRTAAWAPRVAGALALAGVALVGFWLVTGLGRGDPVLVLLAPLLAYAYAAWALLAPTRPAA
jgi:hypothetical protein